MIKRVPVPRRFPSWLLLALAALLTTSVRAADEASLHDALDRLTGEWYGDAQVKAMDGFVLKNLAATRRVTWSQDTLVVETTLKDGDSEYVVVSRQAIRLGRLESVVSRPGQPDDRYVGELSGRTIVWSNAEGNRRDAREDVSERSEELVLETSSVEPMRTLGLSGLVRIEARYRRPLKGGEAPAGATPAADTAELASLRQDLERARSEIATLHARIDEAERRAGDAESRARSAEAAAGASTEARARVDELEREAVGLRERVAAADGFSADAGRQADAAARLERELRDRIAALEGEVATAVHARETAEAHAQELEQSLGQSQRDNERLVAANEPWEKDRAALEARIRELEGQRVAAQAGPTPAPQVSAAGPGAVAPVAGAPTREQLIVEVQRLERRVLELESERNTAREQTTLAQRQLEETRRLRDDTLLRFQAVVAELNATRDEKERLARANVSLQAEVRSAQQSPRPSSVVGPAGDPNRAVVGPAGPATTLDGKTADMVIAALQIIGVTRGETEDKVILDGRVYRNGDLVEAQLGIVFVRIDENSLVFQDRRGREYRRRF